PHLQVMFGGTQAGAQSASVGAYYAGRGNRFSETLFRIGLTPRQLAPTDYMQLLNYGIGLTDIAKHTSGADKLLKAAHFDSAGLRGKIVQYAPRGRAFKGERCAEAVLRGAWGCGWKPCG